jgi:hypothetical protein
MTLPITVPFRDDEPWTGVASRLAIANGYSSMKSFLASAGVHPRNLVNGDVEESELLAKWSGVPADALNRYVTPTASKGGIWKLGDAWFSKGSRRANRIRMCPNCIIEDIETGNEMPSARPRLRAPWLTRAFQNCVEHRRPILEIEVPIESVDEFSHTVATYLEMLRSAATSPHVPADVTVDTFVQDRILGRLTHQHLNMLEVYIVTELAERFGAFLQGYREALGETDLDLDGCDARTLGFNVIAAGPEVIRSVVKAIIAYAISGFGCVATVMS